MRVGSRAGASTDRRRRPASGLAIALLLLACDGSTPPASELAALAPDGERLSWVRRFALDRLLDYRVWSGARAGFVALVARDGQLAWARTSGRADLASGAPMRLDTRFQLASMTKPVTAVAAMILVEEGRLGLDDPVARYLPRFGQLEVVDTRRPDGGWTTRPLETPLRVRHLLTFRSGIGGYAETDDPLDRLWRSPDIEAPGLGSLAERVDRIPDRPLYEPPGERWRYGWSADVLARVVEVAAGMPFDRFLAERIFEPLGMRATAFPDDVPTEAPVARLVTHDAEGELVHHDGFADWYGRGWTPGGGGLVSTAPDYLRFALMLWNGGRWDGVRILSRETVAEMTRLHVEEGVLADMGIEGLGWGLGLCVVADASRTPMRDHDGDFWWSGRFGTQFWVSPAAETVVVVMQQTERSETSDWPVTASLVQAIALP